MNRSACMSKDPAYHSVEFSVEGVEFPYQFRIWDTSHESMSVLVKSDCVILNRLRVGDVLNMKYYSEDSIYPSENIRTAIRYVSEENQGRLRGHSLIGIEIIQN